MEENSSSNNINEAKARKRSTLNTESDPILFFHLLKQNLLWFALIIAICLSAAFVYLRYTTPIYEAKLIYQVNSINTANKVLNVNGFQEANNLAKDVEILKSKLLFKRALERVPIIVSYYNQGEILVNELYKSTPIKVEYVVKDSSILGQPFFIEFIGQVILHGVFAGVFGGKTHPCEDLVLFNNVIFAKSRNLAVP